MISNFNSKNKEHSKTLLFLIALFIVVLAALIAGIISLSNAKSSAAELPTTSLLGDVDGNGKVTAADARLALRAAVALEHYAPGSGEFVRADYDGDGNISASDARMILRTAVELEPIKYLNAGEDTTDPANPQWPTEPDEPSSEPELPSENHTITLSDGRVIPDSESEWDKVFSYNGMSEKDLRMEKWTMSPDELEAKYAGYSCGCKNHTCKTPLDHYWMVTMEIRGCSMCGSHECMRIYTNNDQDCPNYEPPKYPDNCCQDCGKLLGDGTNGTCVQFLRDKNCPNCGEFVKKFTCHTCGN